MPQVSNSPLSWVSRQDDEPQGNAEMLYRWRLDQERRGLLPSTLVHRLSSLRCFAEWLQPATLLEATQEDVQLFLDARRIGSKTRYVWLSNLHSFYAFALAEELVDRDPTARITRPRLRRSLPRPISDADLAFALTAAADRQMRAWLILGAYAGLRCSEIAGLHREDFIDDLGVVRVVGKGRRERLVPIHPAVTEAVAPFRQQRPRLFLRPMGGPWSPAMVSRAIALFFDDINVDATAHQLRHWFGTRAYMASHDIRVVQELMGHSSPTVTAGYAAYSLAGAADAVMALGGPAQ